MDFFLILIPSGNVEHYRRYFKWQEILHRRWQKNSNLQVAFFAISSFTITEKSTSELTESPEENGKLYSGFHVREKKNN